MVALNAPVLVFLIYAFNGLQFSQGASTKAGVEIIKIVYPENDASRSAAVTVQSQRLIF